MAVLEGEHAGRRLWHDSWLTEDGVKYALCDLAKLGVKSVEQLERPPLPAGNIVEANVVLKRDDDGNEWNEIKHTNPLRCHRHRARGARPLRPPPSR
jgi:hypothetical protein